MVATLLHDHRKDKTDAAPIPFHFNVLKNLFFRNEPDFHLIFTSKTPILACMKKKSLFDSNPYLHDRNRYQDSLITSVSSSTAIETGASVDSVSRQIAEAAARCFHTSPTKPESNSQ